jgi:NADH dehydrogenase FAD-containing subunit
VVATGNQDDLTRVPGIGEDGHASTITGVPDAFSAANAWAKYLEDPRDIVIGATSGGGCFGAAYEFLFDTAYQFKKAKLHKKVKLTYVTAEPFLGHFGIGGLPRRERLLGMFTKMNGIETITGVAMEAVEEKILRLDDGWNLDFSWAMVIPAFRGQHVVAATRGPCDDKGFVQVRDSYQSQAYDDVYAVGVAAAVEVPWTTAVPVGIPKTGFPTETQAHVAAENIAGQIRGEEPVTHKAAAASFSVEHTRRGDDHEVDVAGTSFRDGYAAMPATDLAAGARRTGSP